MLTSPTQHEDRKTLADLLDALESVTKMHLETGSFLEGLGWLNERYDALKKKIETHDYTEDDHRWQVVTKALNDKNK